MSKLGVFRRDANVTTQVTAASLRLQSRAYEPETNKKTSFYGGFFIGIGT